MVFLPWDWALSGGVMSLRFISRGVHAGRSEMLRLNITSYGVPAFACPSVHASLSWLFLSSIMKCSTMGKKKVHASISEPSKEKKKEIMYSKSSWINTF